MDTGRGQLLSSIPTQDGPMRVVQLLCGKRAVITDGISWASEFDEIHTGVGASFGLINGGSIVHVMYMDHPCRSSIDRSIVLRSICA